MSTFTNKNAQIFWAKSKNLVLGRYHIGIKNTSVVIVTALLPGLTNQTQRLRYYGFYVWLIHQYEEIFEDTQKNSQHQHLFIRKAELLLAFMMRSFYDVNGVVGSDFVRRNIDELSKKKQINLNKYAAKVASNSRGIYLKGNTHGLRQIYLGSMIYLQLLIQYEGLFFIPENTSEEPTFGEAIAAAFDENVSLEKELFFKIIKSGKFHIDDLNNLKSFSLVANFGTTTEGKLYQSMFGDDDNNLDRLNNTTSLRRKSMITLMEVFNDSTIDFNLIRHHYYQQKGYIGQDNYSDATLGWFYYEVNELGHFALETLFWALLNHLDNFQSIPTLIFLENLLNLFCDNIEQEQLLEEYLTRDLGEPLENIWQIVDAIKTNNTALGMVAAFRLYCLCYVDNKIYLSKFHEFATQYDLKREGNIEDLLHLHLVGNMQKSVHTTMRQIFLWIINQHSTVAYRKMDNGVKNVFKFKIDNGFITLVNPIKPSFTDDRISSLKSFLTDLNLYESQTKQLTSFGHTYLDNLKKH